MRNGDFRVGAPALLVGIGLVVVTAFASGGRGRAPSIQPQQSRPELALQLTHSGVIWSVAWSPDGATIASCGTDETVRLWDAKSGELKRILKEHIEPVNCVAFSPDGSALASGDYSGRVIYCVVSTGEMKWESSAASPYVLSIAFSPDGNVIATGYMDKLVFWEAHTGKILHTVSQSGWVESVAFSPDGLTLAVGGLGVSALYDVRTGRFKVMLDRGLAQSVAFLPDGQTVVCKSRSGLIALWRLGSETPERTFETGEPGMSFSAMPVSPDGSTIALGGRDAKIRVWDLPTSTSKLVIDGHQLGEVFSAAYSPDGHSIVSAGGNRGQPGEIKFWNATTGELKHAIRADEPYELNTVAFSPDGTTIASTSGYLVWGDLRLWNAATGELKASVNCRPGGFGTLVFLPNRKLLAIGDYLAPNSGDDAKGGTKLLDALTTEPKREIGRADDWVTCLAVSRDGGSLACGLRERTVTVWNTRTWKPRRKLKMARPLEQHDPSSLTALAFSPDNRTLATAGERDGTVILWDLATGRIQRILRGHSDIVATVAYSPDGRLIASAGGDQTVRLWDTKTAKVIRTLHGHKGAISSVAFSPNGAALASGGRDKTVRIWNVQTGNAERIMAGHIGGITSGVNSVAFSPDGKTIASGGDRSIMLWDTGSGRLRASLVVLSISDWIAFSPEGYYTGSDGAERFVRWRVDNRLAPPETYKETFRRPDLLKRALQGS